MRRISAAALAIALLSWTLIVPAPSRADNYGPPDTAARLATKTPIKHLVVIFDENNSFDHYFGTYPHNDPSEPAFPAAPDTPAINGLTPTLLTNNPNKATAGNPFLLTRAEAATCDNVNKYTPEQEAFDGGLLDMFNVTNATGTCGSDYFYASNNATLESPPAASDLSMGYYTGNTVTALWNYAQHYALSDNFFDTEFGGTVEGHLNLLSGQTHGLVQETGQTAASGSTIANGTVINNINPIDDDCASASESTGGAPNISMTGNNIGNLLNKVGASWGWFYDGFARTGYSSGVATCTALYNPHYAPFEYYPSTSNPHHTPPTSPSVIGTSGDAANHNYDLCDLLSPEGINQCTAVAQTALAAGNLPAVTFIKFASPNTGHPMNSNPLAEQAAIVNVVNQIMESPVWNDTAIIITYDDSDGWYDHVAGPIVNHSTDAKNDAIQGSPTASTPNGSCGTLASGADNDRCGFGVRLPFLVLSPFAKHNYVDHSLNDTTSIMRFIEYNWGTGTLGSLTPTIANDAQSYDVLASGSLLGLFDFERFAQFPNERLILNPNTGEVERGY